MKHLYFSILAILSVTSVSAQLTLANHAPVIGEMHQRYQCDSTGVVPGPGGANNVWTFTMPTHSSVVHSYTAGSSSFYPPATVSLTSNRGYEDHYKTVNSALTDYSSSFPIVSGYYINLNYNAPAVKAKYPMSLNTTSSTVTNGYINAIMVTAQAGSFTGTSNSVADGTGTLVLPGITYTNVLRVVNTEVISYTVNFPGTITLKNYDFYAVGAKQPVFSIVTATLTRPAGTVKRILVTQLIHPTPAAPVDLTSESDKMVCANASATLTASGAGTIEWFDDVAATTAVGSGSVFTIAPLPVGVYTYYAQATNFVSGPRTAITFTVTDCTSLGNIVRDGNIKLYPNPAQDGQAFVKGLSGPSVITVFNVLGEVILKKQSNAESVLIDLKGQPAGNYIVQVSGKDVYTFKLVNP